MPARQGIASFEQKWAVAYPELALALRFFPEPQRSARSAFACIGYEIAHAAFRIREAQVAIGKLQWWADEFAHLHAGQARHPLTQALVESSGVSKIEALAWQSLISGAMAQREAEPTSSLQASLDAVSAFYRPLASIETTLFGGIDPDAQAKASALSRLLHETIVLTESLEAGRLLLPLDLLARHTLSRSALDIAAEPTRAALREWFGMLAAQMAEIDVRGLAPLAAASLSADRARARRASLAADPLASVGSGLDRLPLGVVWATWRAARRVSRNSGAYSKSP